MAIIRRSLEKHYLNFERPPFAPIYRPTEEEFVDPISYIARIKPEAEQYGVVKIIPPESFRPPFSIDETKFEFTPRSQTLNRLDGLTRCRDIFYKQLHHFWYFQGYRVTLARIDGRYVNFYELSRAVRRVRQNNTLLNRTNWSSIAKQLGHQAGGASRLRLHYERWIEPFEKSLQDCELLESSRETDCSGSITVTNNNDNDGEVKEKGRRKVGLSRIRSMAGVRSAKSKEKLLMKAQRINDPMNELICKKCMRGDDESVLMLCEDCNDALHIYCCDPALNAVPTYAWRCRRCSAATVRPYVDEFAFTDSDTHFTLQSFKQYADGWKQKYFNEDPETVESDLCEKEFWRRIYDSDKSCTVMYGADLLASKVGSGFPVQNCDSPSFSDKAEYFRYAKNPWNLNNLSVLKESVLSHMECEISGMMIPWVYVGMCFSTFCWHTEDHWTYSVNYLHRGGRKIWYGVSGNDGDEFDGIIKALVPDLFEMQPDILHHITAMFNPRLLMGKGLKIYSVHQNPGEFVITFPRAYHAGYNEGLNVAEAVNFAPPDWLPKGRLCIMNYALAKRKCVFSFEEFVIKIAMSSNYLSLAVTVAIYDELCVICDHEARNQSYVDDVGIKRSSRETYENVIDDARSCLICQTTIYLRGVTCKHERLVCMQHIEQLCPECGLDDYIVKYRFTLDELATIRNNIKEKIGGYLNWQSKMGTLLNSDMKPELCDVKNLIATADVNDYPSCAILNRAIAMIKDTQSSVEIIKRLAAELKFETRIPFNDSCVVSLSQINDLMESLPCEVEGLKEYVDRYADRSALWRQRYVEIMSDAESLHKCSLTLTESITELIAEAELIGSDASEVDVLKQTLARCEWISRANTLCEWAENVGIGQTSSEDVQNETRWTLRDLSTFIDEGVRLRENFPLPKPLIETLKCIAEKGWKMKLDTGKVLSSGECEAIGLQGAEKLWNNLKEVDWMTEEGIDCVRREFRSAEKICRLFDHYERDGNYVLKDFRDLMLDCAQSLFMRKTNIHLQVIQIYNDLNHFRDEICRLFVHDSSYYFLFEILKVSDDLSTLINGVCPPLKLLHGCSTDDHWSKIDELRNCENWIDNVKHNCSSKKRNVVTLRRINQKRSVNHTCVCSSAYPADNEGEIISCVLCSAKFHVSCVQRIINHIVTPMGYYMCVRCVRGRRPSATDVQRLCETVHLSAEVKLITVVLDSTMNDYTAAVEAFAAYNNSKKDRAELLKFEGSMIAVLSDEAKSSAFWPLLLPVLSTIWPITASQVVAHQRIQNCPANMELLPILFSDKNNYKRVIPSQRTTRGYRKRKCKRNDESDEHICAAEECHRPTGDEVHWIQCQSDCSRWYHLVCVGQDYLKMKFISSYCCHRCSSSISSEIDAFLN